MVVSVEVSFYGNMPLTLSVLALCDKSLDSYLGQNHPKALQEINLIRLDFMFFFHFICAFREIILLSCDTFVSKVKRQIFLPLEKL